MEAFHSAYASCWRADACPLPALLSSSCVTGETSLPAKTRKGIWLATCAFPASVMHFVFRSILLRLPALPSKARRVFFAHILAAGRRLPLSAMSAHVSCGSQLIVLTVGAAVVFHAGLSMALPSCAPVVTSCLFPSGVVGWLWFAGMVSVVARSRNGPGSQWLAWWAGMSQKSEKPGTISATGLSSSSLEVEVKLPQAVDILVQQGFVFPFGSTGENLGER